MLNFFDCAEACLYESTPSTLLEQTSQAWQAAQQNKLIFASTKTVRPIEAVRFPQRPICLAPTQMPKRKLSTRQGICAFFHAIAHIEFVAIYLAWDMAYRFRHLPDAFYWDWLSVAQEEALHFRLLQTKLHSLGLEYGDLPAHSGLWDIAKYSAEDVLTRLALVPRNMEAHGLDVTPPMIAKFQQMGDDDAVSLLTTILNDEIGHVALGSKWFAQACQAKNIDSQAHYQRILLHYYQTKGGGFKGQLNWSLRQQAGFHSNELQWLEAQAAL